MELPAVVLDQITQHAGLQELTALSLTCRALHAAAIRGHRLLRRQIQAIRDRRAQNERDWTALARAAAKGNTLAVELILKDAQAGVSEAKSDLEEISWPLQLTPFEWAAKAGHVEICRILAERGGFASGQRHHSRALTLAAKEGHIEVCRYLLSIRYDLGSVAAQDLLENLTGYRLVSLLEDTSETQKESPHDTGMFSLHWAAWHGNLSLCQLLLEHAGENDDVDLWNTLDARTPLMLAAMRGNDDVCRLLITHGAKLEPNMGAYENDDSLGCFCLCSSVAAYPILLAAEAGHLTTCQVFYELGAELGVTWRNMGGVVEYALRCKDPQRRHEILRWALPLLNNKAIAWDRVGKNRRGPVAVAIFQDDPEACQLLLEHGAKTEHDVPLEALDDPTEFNRGEKKVWSSFALSIRLKKHKAFDALISKSDISTLFYSADSSGKPQHENVLASAIRTDNQHAAEAIFARIEQLTADAQKEILCCIIRESRQTALTLATILAREEIIESLLSRFPELKDVRDKDDWSPIDYACDKGGEDEERRQRTFRILRLLLDHGADPNLSPDDDFFPLLLTIKHGRVDLAELLLNPRCQVPSSSEDIATMADAVLNDPNGAMKNSLHSDAEATVNPKRHTVKSNAKALRKAAEIGNLDMCRLLVSYGARLEKTDNLDGYQGEVASFLASLMAATAILRS
ncbi:hypothetical protein HDU96_010898 [Phlyctochytrium bullatum]|nr:hypothetical protein HDU96_010898 [Phlyctochytrium bullatum]